MSFDDDDNATSVLEEAGLVRGTKAKTRRARVEAPAAAYLRTMDLTDAFAWGMVGAELDGGAGGQRVYLVLLAEQWWRGKPLPADPRSLRRILAQRAAEEPERELDLTGWPELWRRLEPLCPRVRGGRRVLSFDEALPVARRARVDRGRRS